MMWLFKSGNLNDITKVGEYYMISGEQTCAKSQSNFFIASYITARGRENLHKAQM